MAARLVLRRFRHVAGGEASSVATSSAAPRRARSRSTSSLVSSGADRARDAAASIGPGVERLDDPHDGDAGFALAGDDRAVHRRRAAVAGQQRGVDVEEAEPRRGENRVGQDLPVGGDDAEVGVERRRARSRNAASLSRCGLKDRHAGGERQRLHRRVDGLLAPAARPIRLRDHADDAVPRAQQRLEGRHGEAGRAEEHDTQASGRAASPFAGARQLPDPADDQVALDAAQPVDEQRAVEVIHLVLKRAGEQPGAFPLMLRPGAIERP